MVLYYFNEDDRETGPTGPKIVSEDTISTDDTFVEPCEFRVGKPFSVSFGPGFTGDPVIQQSVDDGATWTRVWAGESDTETVQTVDVIEASILWRAGFESGGLTAGSSLVRMAQDI